MNMRVSIPCLILSLCGIPAPALAQTRGGWLDRTWTYIYEGSFADGEPDGSGIAGLPDFFDSLDGSWDYFNPSSFWQEDLIDERDLVPFPGGVQMAARAGKGDNESGSGAADAETLAILTMLGLVDSANSRIYFERFLTDRSLVPPDDPGFDPAGSGQPAIDFEQGVTIIARFRFFSVERLGSDAALRSELGITEVDGATLESLVDSDGASEYDESPRESFFDQKGMFMVTRNDVHDENAGFAGPGGIYFGVALDGDSSWDPGNQGEIPNPGEIVDVKVAYILGGPGDQNFAFQGSGDSRVIDQLKARGIQVTVLDDGGENGHQFYESGDPAYNGDPGPDAVAHDHDLIVISSTVASNNVRADQDPDIGYRFRETPFICWESGLIAKGYAWMADPNANGFVFGDPPTAPTDTIDIVDNTHPITEGFDLGPQAAFFAQQRMSCSTDPFSGPVAPGVRVLARVAASPPTDLACLLVADPDDPTIEPEDNLLGDGAPPNARSAFFFFEDESAAAANGLGQALFHRTVEWALGEEKAALLGPAPGDPTPSPQDPVPSLYINLGASPNIALAGRTLSTRVLRGAFIRDLSSVEPTVPALGGDTRVWAPLPSGAMDEFVSVYITVEPEQDVGDLPAFRVKVYMDGSSQPAIEIQNHHLDPDILPVVSASADGSGPNDGSGMHMGLWRGRRAGYLDVDYFGYLAGAVPPATPPTGGMQLPADCDQSGALNLTDGICLLGHLFQGSPDVLPCGDGSTQSSANVSLMDVDSSGNVDLTDAVRIFQYLFLGGPPPPLCTDDRCSECVAIEGCPDNARCQ